MVSMDSRNPQGSAHCSPILPPSQQEHVKPILEPTSGQNRTPQQATNFNEDFKSAPQQATISEEETTLEEATELLDLNVQDDHADNKNELENAPKHTEGTISDAGIEEGRSRYRPGGLHPVYIGDVFDNRYKVLNKIGYGIYSTVWLVKDLQQETTDGTEYYALKVLGAMWYGTENDIFELEILKHLRYGEQDQLGYQHVCHLVNDFTITGPNGQHVCLVFELMGETLRSFGARFKESRIQYLAMRRFAIQLILAIDFAHSHNVIHTDIQPSNIFVKFRDRSRIESGYLTEVPIPHQDRSEKDYTPIKSTPLRAHYMRARDNLTEFDITLGDWGVASWCDKHLTENIQPVALRAPEVLLKAPWDKNVDWWNFGALLPELYRAIRMFDGRGSPDGKYDVKVHLSEIVDIFGPFPKALLKKGDKELVQEAFDDQGEFKIEYEMYKVPLDDESWTPDLDKEEREDFVSFLRFVMKIDPAERPTALDMLRHVWIQALPPLPTEE